MDNQPKVFEPIVVTKLLRVYMAIVKLRLKIPKPLRHSLGETIDKTILSALESIFSANTLPRPLREEPLQKTIAKLELAKLLLRVLMQECPENLNTTHFFFLSGELTECCKMVTGWRNYCRQTPK